MADANLRDFQKRLRAIERDHRSLSSGYVRLEERNGLLVPVKRVRTKRGFPWRGLFLVVVTFVLFKALLFAQLGPVAYVERHALLEGGNFVDRMGAFALRPDPATIYLSDKIGPILTSIKSMGVDW
ncbi:hypothetical protein [Maritimibacter sp. DP1N21-5]|uniref:hypothetical protein n=1 Tax=Maritimibacter sp. DP1N21-5 TaxID=2836867 RepID=UPI001C471017|nr:hypothetical protein [Maritimibacter sp. DP1N21-5]MBV7410796.1 hypothetical protein [Maritimibacter sp. DP1N21-5]